MIFDDRIAMLLKAQHLFASCFFIWFMFLLPFHAHAKENFYAKIAGEYDMVLSYFPDGYPIAYDLDLKETSGIVFLTRNAEYMDKKSDWIYVCQPLEKNALEIASFSVETNGFPVYYLVVDDWVDMGELKTFVKGLTKDFWEVEIRFVDGNYTYVPVRFTNETTLRIKTGPRIPGIMCFTNYWDILMNKNDDILFESAFFEPQGVFKEMKMHYLHNIDQADEDLNCANKRQVNKETCLDKIKDLEDIIKRSGDSTVYGMLIEKEKLKLEATTKHGSYMEMPSYFQIRLACQNGTSNEGFYALIGNVQKAVLQARNTYALKRWNKSYQALFDADDSEALFILTQTFPDRLFFELEPYDYFRESPPPPPVLSEITSE